MCLWSRSLCGSHIMAVGHVVPGPLLLTWINLILARINDYIYYNVWGEITFPFPNFNGATVEVWEWISNFIPHLIMDLIIHPFGIKVEMGPGGYHLGGLFLSKSSPCNSFEGWAHVNSLYTETRSSNELQWWQGISIVNLPKAARWHASSAKHTK